MSEAIRTALEMDPAEKKIRISFSFPKPTPFLLLEEDYRGAIYKKTKAN